MAKLRPCPFCNAEPKLSCEWRLEKDHTPQSVWFLTVKHSRRCFIASRLTNGIPVMIVASLNKKKLVEQWNGKFIWECKK